MPQIINQFERKRCQKKRKYVTYQLLFEFFQKCFVVHEWLAVKIRSELHTYEVRYIHVFASQCMLYTGRFILIESVRDFCSLERRPF